MRALSNFFIALLFCAAIYTPMAAGLSGVRAQQIENRPLRQLPTLGAGYFEQLSGFLQDRLPLRAQAIQLQTWIGLNVFGDSPAKDVMLGRNGWLFIAADYENTCNFPAHFDRVIYGLNRLNNLLKSYGKTFIFVVIPDKSEIYGDYASLPMQFRTSASCVSDRRVGLRQIAPNLPPDVMLDLWTPLANARGSPGDEIYRALDTHWTDHGMLIGARQLVDRLQPGLWSEDDVVPIGLDPAIGDLTLILGLPQRETTQRFQVRRPATQLTYRVLTTAEGRAYGTYQASGTAPRLGRAVMLTDSFYEMTIEVLPPYFDQLTYVHMPLRDTEALTCSIAASQTVIYSVAERYIYEDFWWQLGDDNPALEKALAEGPYPPGCPS